MLKKIIAAVAGLFEPKHKLVYDPIWPRNIKVTKQVLAYDEARKPGTFDVEGVVSIPLSNADMADGYGYSMAEEVITGTARRFIVERQLDALQEPVSATNEELVKMSSEGILVHSLQLSVATSR